MHPSDGHTAWWLALNRAGEDVAFAELALAVLAERLMPAALDVQTAQRLVRLVPQQAEYWVLSVMLAGFKTLGSRVWRRPEDAYVYRRGFFNDHLRLTLDRLPLHLWSAPRRKRDYVSSVLAPDGSPADGDRFIWRPVYDVLNLPWVDQGTGHEGEQMSGWRFSSLVSSLLK